MILLCGVANPLVYVVVSACLSSSLSLLVCSSPYTSRRRWVRTYKLKHLPKEGGREGGGWGGGGHIHRNTFPHHIHTTTDSTNDSSDTDVPHCVPIHGERREGNRLPTYLERRRRFHVNRRITPGLRQRENIQPHHHLCRRRLALKPSRKGSYRSPYGYS